MNKFMPPRTSGIYRFINWQNGRMYVGSAVNLYQRRIDHIKELRANKHRNDYLQKAWNKYGEENFIFEVLELCSKDNLLAREQYCINTLNSVNPNGYNLNPIAGSNLNRKFDESFKEKARNRQLGVPRSEITRQRMSEAHSNRKRDPEIGRKISEAKKGKNTGRKHSAEQIEKIKLSGIKTRQDKSNSLWEPLLLKAPINA